MFINDAKVRNYFHFTKKNKKKGRKNEKKKQPNYRVSENFMERPKSWVVVG